jgi:hypothetical protein
VRFPVGRPGPSGCRHVQIRLGDTEGPGDVPQAEAGLPGVWVGPVGAIPTCSRVSRKDSTIREAVSGWAERKAKAAPQRGSPGLARAAKASWMDEKGLAMDR